MSGKLLFARHRLETKTEAELTSTPKKYKCKNCGTIYDSKEDAMVCINTHKATAPVKTALSTFKYRWTASGLEAKQDLLYAYRAERHPAIMIGGTGGGKSVAVRSIAEDEATSFSAMNAHPGMDVADMIGRWTPEAVVNNVGDAIGVTVSWRDAALTRQIRGGGIFALEEITRAPQDGLPRFFGLMDDGFRYMNLLEADGRDIEVHKDFWMVATANPIGSNYYTTKLDEALRRRFAFVEIKGILADEPAMLRDVFGDKPGADLIVDKIMRFVEDLRGRTDLNAFINTAEVRGIAKFMHYGGAPPKKAIEMVVSHHYEKTDGIKELATAHF